MGDAFHFRNTDKKKTPENRKQCYNSCVYVCVYVNPRKKRGANVTYKLYELGVKYEVSLQVIDLDHASRWGRESAASLDGAGNGGVKHKKGVDDYLKLKGSNCNMILFM